MRSILLFNSHIKYPLFSFMHVITENFRVLSICTTTLSVHRNRNFCGSHRRGLCSGNGLQRTTVTEKLVPWFHIVKIVQRPCRSPSLRSTSLCSNPLVRLPGSVSAPLITQNFECSTKCLRDGLSRSALVSLRYFILSSKIFPFILLSLRSAPSYFRFLIE